MSHIFSICRCVSPCILCHIGLVQIMNYMHQVSNLTLSILHYLLVMSVTWSPYVPLEMVFVDKCTIAHGVLIFFMAIGRMLYDFVAGKSLSIVKFWTIVMNPRNMLTQIIFRSNRFPAFTWMTAFLMNCKLVNNHWCVPVDVWPTGLYRYWAFRCPKIHFHWCWYHP